MDPIKVQHVYLLHVFLWMGLCSLCFLLHYPTLSLSLSPCSVSHPSHSLINSHWPLRRRGPDHWWIYPTVQGVCEKVGLSFLTQHAHARFTSCMCVLCECGGTVTERWTHRLSQGHHLTCIACVCVWDRVCVWHWEEGRLMRALIKKQTVYWINPVVINRPQSSQPPALCVLPLCSDVTLTLLL